MDTELITAKAAKINLLVNVARNADQSELPTILDEIAKKAKEIRDNIRS